MCDLRSKLDSGLGGMRHNRPFRRTSSLAAAAAAAVATPPPPPPALYSSSSQPPTPSRARASRPSTAAVPNSSSSSLLDSLEDDQMRPPPRRPSTAATSRPRTSHGSSASKRMDDFPSPSAFGSTPVSSRENSGSSRRLTRGGSIGSSSGGSIAGSSTGMSTRISTGVTNGKPRTGRPPKSNPSLRSGQTGLGMTLPRREEETSNPPTLLPRRGVGATAETVGVSNGRRRRQTSGN